MEARVVKVIIAEDDLLIADLLEDVLVRAGYEVCGMASTDTETIELCNQHTPNLAVIDMRLAEGGRGSDVAARVDCRDKLGILYATGNAGHTGLTAADGEACITKPYQAADIVRALRLVQEIVETGRTSKPFPRNFVLLRETEVESANEARCHGKT
jgi:ActR/RegA family two-component response regulator